MGLAVVSGCRFTGDESIARDDSKPFLTIEKIAGSKIGALRDAFRMSSFGYTPDKLDEYRSGPSGKTILAWDSSHGTEVEYLAADGRTYLRYTGNTRVVAGRWSIDNVEKQPTFGKAYERSEICFTYGADTYNPTTGRSGSPPECNRVSYALIRVDQAPPGDPFRLASGNIPFPLDKRYTTLDELYTQASGE